MERIKAVYDGETFRPLVKLKLAKGTEVEIILKPTVRDIMKKYQLETDKDIDKIIREVRGRDFEDCT